ncbi:MAG: hypothetical protein ACRCS8_05230 [Brevinema sp.]
MKQKIPFLFLVIVLFTQNSFAQASVKNPHRISLLTSFLVQNSPFVEFATYHDNLWYATHYNVWKAGNAGLGFGIGFAYDYSVNKFFMLRLQAQIESTGWVMGTTDFGFGIRAPINKKVNVSLEGYLSISQTGGTLSQIGYIDQDFPLEEKLYFLLFGFKTRLAFEFAVGKNHFISPYISYASYPWRVGTLKDIYLNGSKEWSMVDSLNIGLEFGLKF